ncbi:MAG: energy transducer TonB [Gammaproteobacteria bacterium]
MFAKLNLDAERILGRLSWSVSIYTIRSWALPTLFSLGVTSSLFLLMIVLIEAGDQHREIFKGYKIKDVVMPQRDIEVVDIPDPEPPPDLLNPPEVPQPQNDADIQPINTSFVKPVINNAVSFTGAALGQNSELIPIVRVNPVYPQRAVSRGIEGWVMLEFTINGDGRTKDISVIRREPSSIFDGAAIKAISKWRYRPRIIDGEPQEVEGVQVRLTFELEKGTNQSSRNLF